MEIKMGVGGLNLKYFPKTDEEAIFSLNAFIKGCTDKQQAATNLFKLYRIQGKSIDEAITLIYEAICKANLA